MMTDTISVQLSADELEMLTAALYSHRADLNQKATWLGALSGTDLLEDGSDLDQHRRKMVRLLNRLEISETELLEEDTYEDYEEEYDVDLEGPEVSMMVKTVTTTVTTTTTDVTKTVTVDDDDDLDETDD